MALTTRIHFLILGDCGVGKTTLVTHFVNDSALSNTAPTLTFDFSLKHITDVRHGRLAFCLWDAAGDDRSHTQSNALSLYYRNKHAIVVVYDLSDRATFERIQQVWLPRMREARALYGADWRLCLVANKLDIGETQRQVSWQEGRELAFANGMEFLELSSLQGHYEEMRQPFLLMATHLLESKLVQATKDDCAPVTVLLSGPTGHASCC